MTDYNSFFDMFEQKGIKIDAGHRSNIERRINEMLNYQPKVGVFGKTGVGKSSLCNAVFGQDICEISDIDACTRQPQEVLLSLGSQGKGIKLLDVPGVGESEKRDEEYAALYKKLLPELDLVLWVIKGDDRAFTSDELFYKKLVRPYVEQGRPFFIVINQIDKIEPFREWDEKTRQPGPKQAQNIKEKRSIVASIFDLPLASIIPVSAHEKYGLVDLVDNIVHSLPKDKKFIVLKEVREENRSERAEKEATSGFWDTVIDVVANVVSGVKAVLDVLSIFKFW